MTIVDHALVEYEANLNSVYAQISAVFKAPVRQNAEFYNSDSFLEKVNDRGHRATRGTS